MNNNDVTIVYLWAEITGYINGVLKALAERVKSIDVVHWDGRSVNSTQHVSVGDHNLKFHPRSVTDDVKIFEILSHKKPKIIVISGWMDKGYINACQKYKKAEPSVKIVAGIDDQWTGSIRQHLGRIYYTLFYRRLFDFMWVSGSAQFVFARNFGYSQNEIISYLYCGGLSTDLIANSIPKKFIFFGRLLHSKGVDLLVDAHKQLSKNHREKLPLHIYGDGELRSYVESAADSFLVYHGWGTENEMRREFSGGAIGVMPSRREQWGVAIHEYTQLGAPLLLSDVCGSISELLIDGYNGFRFKSGSLEDLVSVMLRYATMSADELNEFCCNSHRLSRSITLEMSVASLLSVLKIQPVKVYE